LCSSPARRDAEAALEDLLVRTPRIDTDDLRAEIAKEKRAACSRPSHMTSVMRRS
jgi:hypothetical protein